MKKTFTEDAESNGGVGFTGVINSKTLIDCSVIFRRFRYHK